MSKELTEKLIKIQSELKAPKNQRNNFGKYNYRSCEDILEGLKPLLAKEKLTLIIADDLVLIGDRYYVKADVRLTNGEETIEVTAYAREDESRKGMSSDQITGSASSYARKYALNGMFLIDDTKDADTQDNTDKKKPEVKTTAGKKASDKQLKAIFAIAKDKGVDDDQIKRAVKRDYDIDSRKDLTAKQASELIKKLDEMEKPEVEEVDENAPDKDWE